MAHVPDSGRRKMAAQAPDCRSPASARPRWLPCHHPDFPESSRSSGHDNVTRARKRGHSETMPKDDIWATISRHVETVSGKRFAISQRASASGGCINTAHVIHGQDGSRYFIKLNDAAHADMFAAEHDGLLEIQRSGAIRVPEPLCHGMAGSHGELVLEFLELGRGNAACVARLGRELAAMDGV